MSAAPLRRRAARSAMALACLAAFAAGGIHADAAAPAWSGSRFVYATEHANLGEVLNDFAASQHLVLRMAGSPAGVVSGRYAMPPGRFLDLLCASYGLVWYYDGTALRISEAGAQQPLAIRPNYLRAPQLRAALEGAGVADTHFPLIVNEASGTLTTYGPASYLAQVRDAAERFEADARNRVPTSVHVFRLSVATAADETRQIDGRTVTVAGAATRLRERLHPSPSAHAGTAGVPLEFDAPLPVIEADAATNSILVRDRPDRIDGDAALVADVDTRPGFVVLLTRVVQVPANALGGLAGLNDALRDAPAQDAPRWLVEAGGAATLLAGLDALAGARGARVELARTALTPDHTPAVFDRHEARLVARAATSDGMLDDEPDDDGEALWLSVEPAIADGTPEAPVDLQVRLGGPDGARGKVDARVPPGQALVIFGPGSSPAVLRVIVVVPRIAA